MNEQLLLQAERERNSKMGATPDRYDANGERILKSSDMGELEYVSASYVVRNGTIVSKHVFAGNGRVASTVGNLTDEGKTTTNSVLYYHPDHLGSSSYVTDKQGRFYEAIEYLPYGETLYNERTENDGVSYKYTGKEEDAETGLYYYGARYYDAKLCRWLSVDPILESYLPSGNKRRDVNLPGGGGVFDPGNLNLYCYAGNNPIIYKDPDGNHKEHTTSFNSLFRGKFFLQRAFVVYNEQKGVIRDPSSAKNDLGVWKGTNMGYSKHTEPGAVVRYDADKTKIGVEQLVGKTLVIRENGKMYLIEIAKTSSGEPDNTQPNRFIFYNKTEIGEDGRKIEGTLQENLRAEYNPDGSGSFNPEVITGYTFIKPPDSEKKDYQSTDSHPSFVQNLTDNEGQYVDKNDKVDESRYGHK